MIIIIIHNNKRLSFITIVINVIIDYSKIIIVLIYECFILLLFT